MSAREVLEGISAVARDDTHPPSRLAALEWLANYYRLVDGARPNDDGPPMPPETRAVRAAQPPCPPPESKRDSGRLARELRAMVKQVHERDGVRQ